MKDEPIIECIKSAEGTICFKGCPLYETCWPNKESKGAT